MSHTKELPQQDTSEHRYNKITRYLEMLHLHPLANLTVDEACAVRDLIKSAHSNAVIEFREIGMREPSKQELVPFLELENSGKLTQSTLYPLRLAYCHYDTVGPDKIPVYREAVVDIAARQVIQSEIVSKTFHASLTLAEFETAIRIIHESTMYKEALAELELPVYIEPIVEPWPYGALETDDKPGRYFQGVIYGKDTRSGNADTNFYAFPIPLLPIVDYYRQKVVRVIKLATGGIGDSLSATPIEKNVLDHCTPAEYAPELIPNGTRRDFKSLDVTQPSGPSFKVTDESLVEWQKWRFRVGWTSREGAVIHDVRYDGRSLFHRLSISEMYFDAFVVKPDGQVERQPNVICLHEQDNGIGWKHTNWRTGRAVVTRNRELVVQFILTLANYEYIFAYKFNLAGGIDIEVRATGIVSCVNIDAGKASEYGNIVNPGVLAQNHQHIFAVRIDPAIDGHRNTLIQEESLQVMMNEKTNPSGNFYQVVNKVIKQSSWADAMPMNNRIFKIVNPSKKNPTSGKPVGYKLITPPTQLLLADPDSKQAKRAKFAQHHVWVTKYRDGELWAAGKYPFQSDAEVGGVHEMVARGDDIENEDIVVWSVFCLTHNPRVEDWPVMPVETHHVQLRPSDFFTGNPSIDVPSVANNTSQLVGPITCC
ncbi:copper amine oxidase [Colletotrichum costaricense]|uniref:Amine oxidase n=1 Tax=Colletotrichum costaricense TaxID=1209916 RepID=A0AAI9YHM9_9PEZI|nr:copper amine oxidase [Colletotrichum costaricense]KAK1509322.1 copper amine oxidase [Colletotrichum costaricense]